MLEGGFVIDDRLVTLADIDLPILSFVGTVDQIAPARACARSGAPRRAPRCTSSPCPPVTSGWSSGRRPAGHLADRRRLGRWRAGEGELPERIEPIVATANAARALTAAAAASAKASSSAARSASAWPSPAQLQRGGRAQRARDGPRGAGALPRLARLEQIQPATRISLGLLLDEQARRRPDDMFFLFDDRAYAPDDLKGRVDNVVAG